MPRKTAKKSSAAVTKINKAQLQQMYTQMVRIREFEEAVKRAFIEHPGGIRILTHCLELAAIPRRRNGNG